MLTLVLCAAKCFFFNWPFRIRTRKSALICFHLIVYSARFSHIYADTVRVFLITKLQKIIWRWIGATKASVSSILPTTHTNPAVCTGNRAFQKCCPIWKRHPGVLDWTAKRKMKTDLCVKLNVKASWIPWRTNWVCSSIGGRWACLPARRWLSSLTASMLKGTFKRFCN